MAYETSTYFRVEIFGDEYESIDYRTMKAAEGYARRSFARGAGDVRVLEVTKTEMVTRDTYDTRVLLDLSEGAN